MRGVPGAPFELRLPLDRGVNGSQPLRFAAQRVTVAWYPPWECSPFLWYPRGEWATAPPPVYSATIEQMVAGSVVKCAIVAAAALAVGSLSTVAADDTSQFRGSGIYRPFNLMRQVKLSTAYLVNPSLPSRVDITYAHRLGDVIEGLHVKKVADALRTGDLRLAVPVDESSGYLTPIRAPCQLQAGSRQSSEAPGCVDWLNALREERPDALREFYVFVDKELSVTGSGRLVTWDPHELVESQCDLPLSSDAVQPR